MNPTPANGLFPLQAQANWPVQDGKQSSVDKLCGEPGALMLPYGGGMFGQGLETVVNILESLQ